MILLLFIFQIDYKTYVLIFYRIFSLNKDILFLALNILDFNRRKIYKIFLFYMIKKNNKKI